MSYPDIGQSLGKRNHSTIMSNLGQRPNRKKFRADKTVLDHIIEAEDKKTKEPKPVPVLLGQESLI